MLLRLFFAILFISFFTSCDFISPKNSRLQNLVYLDTIIDYNSVDVYPLLTACNSCDTNIKQNQCFEKELLKSLKVNFEENNLKADKQVTDTVFVDILVDNKGKISVTKIYESPEVLSEIPNFDTILRKSIQKLPVAIQPSLKRGIPVNAKFKLPVVFLLKE